MNNNAPDNGDFAAYLENLDRRHKTNASPTPATNSTPTAIQHLHSEDLTDQERLSLQELAELPPISDDDLLTQALASAGETNEYDLDEKVESSKIDEQTEAKADLQNGTGTEQADLAFLGEHALQLADQTLPENFNEIPPITDEELIQQALACPADNEDISPA